MSRRTVLACAIISILLLCVTNPSRSDYLAWLKEREEEQAEGLARLLVATVGDRVFDESTTHRNYGVCSVYRTASDPPMVVLGIGGRFIILR